MKKNTTVQFVGFITSVAADEFVTRWEPFAKQFIKGHGEMILEQAETKGKFKYVSQFECPQEDFKFAFMKGRTSENFPDHFVKVAQLGGYTAMQIKYKQGEDSKLVKVIAFISHNENDIEFYKTLPSHKYLNIFEAFYENCMYGYILEFFSAEAQAPDLIQQLKDRVHAESAIYKECLVPHV
jgi:hypothetical protein